MSTRGYMGIQKKGELKGQYNHFDSYISGLGKDIIKTLNSIPKEDLISKLNEVYDNIILINEDDKPTQEMIDYAVENGLYDNNVSNRSTDDLYCLLRNTQGRLDLYLKGLKYMLNGNDFLKDDIFCEYGYVINLDENTLDIYTCGKLNYQADLRDLNYKKIEREFRD